MKMLLLFLCAWHLAPLVMLALLDVPAKHKAKAAFSFLLAAVKSLLVLPVVLLTPFIVPVALLFTAREANALPGWARWWDNDVSINGDWPQYWEPDYVGVTYYANAHPRSYWARFVWLVLRNRASWFAQRIGHVYVPGEQDDRETWGDVDTGRAHEGTVLNRCASVYQLYRVKRLPFGLCLRVNYGHKIWSGYDKRPVAMVIAITASVLTWQGA